jgi:hypothetical protein
VIREIIVFLDRPAEAAIEEACQFVAGYGVTFTHRGMYSVSIAEAAPPVLRGDALPAGAEASKAQAGGALLPRGSAQLAAVPVQVAPAWCRLWITASGPGAASDAVDAFVEAHRERSRRVEAAVRALERPIFDEDRWPSHEATLRAALERQGLDEEAIAARVAKLKARWLAAGRRLAEHGPEEPPAA